MHRPEISAKYQVDAKWTTVLFWPIKWMTALHITNLDSLVQQFSWWAAGKKEQITNYSDASAEAWNQTNDLCFTKRKPAPKIQPRPLPGIPGSPWSPSPPGIPGTPFCPGGPVLMGPGVPGSPLGPAKPGGPRGPERPGSARPRRQKETGDYWRAELCPLYFIHMMKINQRSYLQSHKEVPGSPWSPGKPISPLRRWEEHQISLRTSMFPSGYVLARALLPDCYHLLYVLTQLDGRGWPGHLMFSDLL